MSTGAVERSSTVAAGLAIAPLHEVRSLAVLTAVAIVALWVMFRHPNTAANAEAAVDRPVARLQDVRSVSLDGQRLPQARLRQVLETQPGQQLDTARLARDRDAMEHELAGLGYLAARVEPAVVTFDMAGARTSRSRSIRASCSTCATSRSPARARTPR